MKVCFNNHPCYAPGNEYPDEEIRFYDDFLYVIHGNGESGYKVERIILLAEFCDEPISLADIARDFPDVVILLHEEPLRGEVFRYNNHLGEGWELVGATVGYA